MLRTVMFTNHQKDPSPEISHNGFLSAKAEFKQFCKGVNKIDL